MKNIISTKKYIIVFVTLILLAVAFTSYAEIAVIVNPNNKEKLSKDQIINIFLLSGNSFPDGSKAIPIAQNNNELFDEFSNKVIGRRPQQVNATWKMMLFTGKGQVKYVTGDKEMINEVSSDPQKIGYINKSSVNESIRVLMEFK